MYVRLVKYQYFNKIHDFSPSAFITASQIGQSCYRSYSLNSIICFFFRLPQEDLSKLADEFLQVKITHKEEGDTTQTKKLPPESQNFLKDFLKKSSVVTVRPTAVCKQFQISPFFYWFIKMMYKDEDMLL